MYPNITLVQGVRLDKEMAAVAVNISRVNYVSLFRKKSKHNQEWFHAVAHSLIIHLMLCLMTVAGGIFPRIASRLTAYLFGLPS